MNKNINWKRTYVKPSMKVYPLRQKPKLLVGSTGGSVPAMPGYPGGGDPLNP